MELAEIIQLQGYFNSIVRGNRRLEKFDFPSKCLAQCLQLHQLEARNYSGKLALVQELSLCILSFAFFKVNGDGWGREDCQHEKNEVTGQKFGGIGISFREG